MDFKNKAIAVIGLGKTGIAVVNFFVDQKSKVTGFEDGERSKFSKEELSLMETWGVNLCFGEDSWPSIDFDLAVISPGVPTTHPIAKALSEKHTPLIGEVELAYETIAGIYYGITGTNGKTTTTALVGALFEAAHKPHFVVGNIGTPAISIYGKTDVETPIIMEISSFQSETLKTFRPTIMAVTNLSEDHLNRHGTFEAYIEAKANSFRNQKETDYLILNRECHHTWLLREKTKGCVVPFSVKRMLDFGVFIQSDYVVVKDKVGEVIPIIHKKELKIPGEHNLENVLTAVGIAYFAGLPVDAIRKGLATFLGVPHRIEWVGEKRGVKFYNDSKGTNPEASIKAIEALGTNHNLLLIAGGISKDSDFTEFIKSFKGKVKKVALLGETSELIMKTGIENGFNQFVKCDTMKACVKALYEAGTSNDIILLSPGCASWDMYASYEERGDDFKDCFKMIEE